MKEGFLNQLKCFKMNNSYKLISFKFLEIFLIFILSFILFSFSIINGCGDFSSHFEQILKINLGQGSYPPNFLFYFVTALISGYSTNIYILSFVAISILSASISAKYLITKNIISLLIDKHSDLIKPIIIKFLSFALIICFAIPDFIFLDRFYLGKFVPNVWHNSTIIFLFPFSIWLFWEQLLILKYPKKTTTKKLFILSSLVLINALIKPSFLFVFTPVTFVFILLYFKTLPFKKIFIAILPLCIGVISIGIIYYFIYYLQWGDFYKGASNVVISKPFWLFSNWVPLWYLPISMLVSFAFPIVVFFFYYKEIIKYLPFVFALTLTISGILLSAFVVEEGPRQLHGNFTWQNIICTYLLFLSTVAFMIPKFINVKNRKIIFIKFIFLLHFFGGIIYLIKIIVTTSYA